MHSLFIAVMQTFLTGLRLVGCSFIGYDGDTFMGHDNVVTCPQMNMNAIIQSLEARPVQYILLCRGHIF